MVVPGNQHELCSSWSDSTGWETKNRRTYASRKWVMSKKKKKSQALSDSSDEEKNYGNTSLPHMALLPGGRPIKVATPKVLVLLEV